MPTLSSTGIGSGLDVSGIINGLMSVERRPLEILQAKSQLITSKISAYGELVSGISAFQSSISSLNSLDALDKFKTTSTDDSSVKITSTDEPELGSYNIIVNRLAEQHRLVSSELLSTDTFGGSAGDSITIQVGANAQDSITIDLSTALTLSQIRDAITNDDNNPGLKASVINGNDSNQKLIFNSNDIGADNAITFAYGGNILASTFDFQTLNDIGGDLAKLDAEFSIDGYTITRPENSISDVITGVTFDLLKADLGNAHTISVSKDNAAAEKQVKTLADAYNKLRTTISSQRSGSLGTDNVLSMLQNQIISILNTPATTGSYSVLSQIGLSIQKDGSMQVDSEVLTAALETNPADVAQLLAADGDGFANRLSTLSDNWISSNGLLNSRTEGLNDRISDITDQQLNIERRLTQVEARYRAQFSALDTLVSQFQNTGAFLTSQLAQLPSLTLNKSR
jgi:flagellar hook-associated protein 2